MNIDKIYNEFEKEANKKKLICALIRICIYRNKLIIDISKSNEFMEIRNFRHQLQEEYKDNQFFWKKRILKGYYHDFLLSFENRPMPLIKQLIGVRVEKWQKTKKKTLNNSLSKQ